jgi:HK97 family phage prohead protease
VTIEYRSLGGSASASEGVLRGLVTPFNVWTPIGDKKRGGFDERIAPGTFAKTLQERDIVLINNHDTGQPMARTSIADGVGSLALREDPSAGLRALAKPVDTSYARDVMACADAGVTRGMSFGFEVIKDEWTDDEGRASNPQTGTKRTVLEVRLHEVTTTAFPAYTTTSLSARDSVNAARGIVEARQSTGDSMLEAAAELLTAYNALPADQRAAFLAAIEARDVGMQDPDSNPPDNSCPGACPTCGTHAKGEDGDGDSDADDQVIDRSTEPAETTPPIDPAELRAMLARVYGV